MDKGLFFMTLSLVCVWLILDDFFGQNYITRLVSHLIPDDLGSVSWINKSQAATDKANSKKKVQDDPKLNQKEKDYLNKNIDHFYGDVEVH